MKITFANSFWQSLKNIEKYGTWWYRIYTILRYEILHFFKNIWKFRRELWGFAWWDHTFMLKFMRRSLLDMAANTEKYGWEVDKTRLKKVDKMFRAAAILDNIIEYNYTEMAEKQLGKEMKHDWDITEEGELIFNTSKKQERINKQICDLANKLEEEEWKELWRIFQGQDRKEYSKILKKYSSEEQRQMDIWGDWYDGSGAKNWWD